MADQPSIGWQSILQSAANLGTIAGQQLLLGQQQASDLAVIRERAYYNSINGSGANAPYNGPVGISQFLFGSNDPVTGAQTKGNATWILALIAAVSIFYVLVYRKR